MKLNSQVNPLLNDETEKKNQLGLTELTHKTHDLSHKIMITSKKQTEKKIIKLNS